MSWSPCVSSSRHDSWWLDDEPGARDGAQLARELILAGRQRAGFTLLVGLAFAVLAVVVFVVLRPDYAPRFVLRVVEPNADPTAMPRARRELAEYVREGVLTSNAVLDVMQRHDINPALRRANPEAAVASFREDTRIEVYQNYFLEERTVAEAPRSARLVLSYRSQDPELALSVTRELGQLVIDRERRTRALQSERLIAVAEATRERASRSLGQHRARITRLRALIRASVHPDPLDEVQLVSLLGSLAWREQELERSQARKAAAELAASLESRKLGLSFEVADEGAAPMSARPSVLQLCFLGLGAFVLGLPFAAALVGAFDSNRGET